MILAIYVLGSVGIFFLYNETIKATLGEEHDMLRKIGSVLALIVLLPVLAAFHRFGKQDERDAGNWWA